MERGATLVAALRDWREPFLIPLVVLVVTRVLFAVILPLAAEDAYITFRYAWNLQAGNGFVYNPGERVMGFTSPLWAVWMALGIRLAHDPVPWARASALIADAVTLVTLAWLLRREYGRASGWCFAIFFAGWNYFAAVSASGMEMSLLVALASLAAFAIARGGIAAGPALGALALTRPEGLVAALVLGIRARSRDRLIAAAIVAAGLGALWLYFGTIVPRSLIAKAKLYGTPGPWAGRLWWEWASPFPLGTWGETSEGQIVSRLAVVLGPAAVTGAIAMWRQRSGAIAVATLAGLTVWAGYAALGVAYFYWYLAVPLVAAALLAAVGLPRIVRGPAVYAGAALFVAGAWLIAPALYIDRARAEAHGFFQTARELATMARPGEKILLEPIGIIGYTCPLVVVDESGLVTPGVMERRLAGPGWLADLTRAEKPDWLLLRKIELSGEQSFAGAGRPFRSDAERDSVLARYRIAAWSNQDAGDLALALMRREPGAVGSMSGVAPP